jgi:site-specific DNA recombinase
LNFFANVIVLVEAGMIARGVEQVDVAIVKTYAQNLRSLLEEADFTERKAFLRSFIKRIEVNKKQVTVHHNLPIPQGMPSSEQVGVLPIETLGGPKCTVGRTFSLSFNLAT